MGALSEVTCQRVRVGDGRGRVVQKRQKQREAVVGVALGKGDFAVRGRLWQAGAQHFLARAVQPKFQKVGQQKVLQMLAEGVGLRFGVRGQVVEVGCVCFGFHIAHGRVLMQQGEVGSSDGGAGRLVDDVQAGAQGVQQLLQRAMVGQFACGVRLLHQDAKLLQVLPQRTHMRFRLLRHSRTLNFLPA